MIDNKGTYFLFYSYNTTYSTKKRSFSDYISMINKCQQGNLAGL